MITPNRYDTEIGALGDGGMDVEPTVRGRVGSRATLLLGVERKKTVFAMLSLTRFDRKAHRPYRD